MFAFFLGAHLTDALLSPKENVTYCSHEIGSDGLKKSQDKIDAILKVKKPENVTQLRSFLGLVQYYGKFLQNLATEARPLNELLEKTRKWKWTDQCDAAFENIKKLVTSDQVLTHHDPALSTDFVTGISNIFFKEVALVKIRAKSKSLHSAKYIVKIFQVFLFRLTGRSYHRVAYK
jgi:hypothetical protein